MHTRQSLRRGGAGAA
ncbi:hypothetical protein YPPY98_4572, partial [Yersinia pestis PY-98]